MTLVILLSGWAGSGKDSAAELLVEEMAFVRVAFADMLKEEVSTAYRLPLAVFHNAFKDRHIDALNATPRQLLVQHAADRKRKDPDVYSRAVVSRIAETQGRVVVSDWRYRHEYAFLKEQLPNVHIVRGRILRSSVSPHEDPSEHDLDDEPMDFTVINDGCISDLRDAIKAAVRPYFAFTA
jgi:hypothetical protein